MKLASLQLLAALIASASALHIPFERRAPIKRAGNQPNSSDPYYFENLSDLLYVGTIYVDGQPFQVQLDSGSSDLWIDTTGVTFANAKGTGVVGSIQYLDTTLATGQILISSVTFGNWTAPQQAFISAAGTNATTLGDKGLLGVGPPLLSSITSTLAGSSYNGASFLDNVFTAYPNDPNIITFLLSRNNYGTTVGGDFTIGGIVPGYEAITQEQHLNVITPDQWVTLMDGVLVGGSFYSGNSQYLTGKQLSVLLDSGTSYGTATKSYVDAIYSSSPAAQWSQNDNTYLFPCDTVYNVSMVFGQQQIFMHPIDMGTPYGMASDGTAWCSGAFSVNGGSGVDLILGDSFLRNVYSLFYFGGWTSSANDSPYMQIAGVTNPNQALSEFASLNAQRVTNMQNGATNATSNAVVNAIANGNSSSASSSPQTVDLSSVNRNSYIIMGMIGLAILLLLLNLMMRARANQGYKRVGAPGSAPHPHFVDNAYTTPYDR